MSGPSALWRLPVAASGRRLFRSAPVSGRRGLTAGVPMVRPTPGAVRGLRGLQAWGVRHLATTGGNVDADVIITNGHVIDPANKVDAECDVAIKDGVIVAVGRGLSSGRQDVYYDARGCLVTPGLIDVQVHAYQYATPFGVDIDHHCLGRGVTTAVDGGAAGATTFMGLKKFIRETKKTRLYAFLNIAMHGMSAGDKAGHVGMATKDVRHFGRKDAGRVSVMKDLDVGGEYDSLKLIDPDVCKKCIEDNLDMIVGIKVRLRADACAAGKNEDDAFRIALSTCQKTNMPLMTHHAESTIPTEAMTGTMGCPGSLRKGDIYSQAFQGHANGILDPRDLSVYESVLNARERGVYFDVGHGQKAFTWTVAERCAEKFFYPDLISTNLHCENTTGPVYDLTTVMTKMLHVGMPLNDVIEAVTSNAARALRKSNLIGSLGVGRCADVTVLREDACSVDLEDANGQLRKVTSRLTPVAVWREGVAHDIVELEKFPNPDIVDQLRMSLKRCIINDETIGETLGEMRN